MVDARAYDTIAWHLVQGYGYRESLDAPLANDNAIIRVGPGYEFFLAGIYAIFGHHYQIVWVIQAFLTALSAFLIFLLTKEIFKNHWSRVLGLTAAALIGFSPDLITMQAMLMTETLGVFLIILSALFLFKYLNRQSWRYLILMSISLGAAALVRTPAIFLFFPIAGYLFWNKKQKALLVSALIIFLMFLPWIVRNYGVFHIFLPTNAASGFNLLAGNHLGASGEQEPYLLLDYYVSKLGYLKANQQATKDALSFMAVYPWQFLKLTLSRISIYFSFSRPTGFWFHLHGLSKALTLISSAIYSVILFLFGFWGISRITKLETEEKNKTWLLLAMLAMMPLAVIGIIVETRYRFLSYPFFAVFAGFGFQEFLKKRLEWKPALLIFGLLFLNTALDIIRNFGRILERIHNL